MTEESQVADQKDTKEYNFRMLEQKKNKEIEDARRESEQYREQLDEMNKRLQAFENQDDDDVYVDKNRLERKLKDFGQQTQKQTKHEVQTAVNAAIKEEKRQNWLKQNSDFQDVLKHADKLAEKDPDLAESILEMPEGFERQKLAYKSIKAMGLHKPPQQEQSMQDKVNQNRKGLYYQPSDVNSSPYGASGDFSAAGQKNAYDQLQKWKKNMRIN